jgi:YD repeat-containing protein
MPAGAAPAGNTAASAREFPATAHEFLRNHAAPARPVHHGLAHLLVPRALRVGRLRGRPGVRASGPTVFPGALYPARAPKNVGAIVVAYMARSGPTPKPTPTPVTLSVRRSNVPAGARRASSIDITQQNLTGINRWWSYEEGAIPGVGRWMVNAYSGNLIVQADDMDVPHRGIDLAFRRTYNSFSRHDFAGSDGATEVGQYGSGWTNTFDAHLSTNGCPNTGYSWAGFFGFSVHDVDGARYDYCFNASGQLLPPAGMQGTSLVANPDGGSFYWTKKTGTQYTFYAPYYGGTSAAYSGRLYRISGRNQNNYIQFTYAWSPDASASANLANTYATTDNGSLQATLTFANFNGQQLLSQLTRPDGATITYDYDAAGELIAVSRPPPNNSGAPVVETYNGYQSFLMVTSPRWTAGGTNDGGYVAFYMDETTTAQVDGIEFVGVMNFMPNDNTGTLVQLAVATGPILYRWEGVAVTPSYTAFSDTDGHGEVQYLDASGRPTVRQAYTGSQWLQSTAGWDANNQLISSTDARGNEADFAYDVHGNTVAAAAPPPTPGAPRPTQLFTYDANDNVTAYCDPNATQSLGLNWTSPPTAPMPGQGGLCPQTTVAQQYQWTTRSYDPFGELSATISQATVAAPLGYTRTISYDTAQQGGADYGLPTRVAGAAITQSTDPTTPSRQPLQTFWYDGNGSLVCYGTGSGQWLLTYDTLGRVTSSSDPDDSAGGSGVCGKTGAQPGWNTTSRTTYFPNGAVATKQSASQVANGVSTAFTYDVDGNVTSETHHYGCTSTASCTAGVTTKWYDGANRLAEVQQPYDGNDIQAYPWSTRYIYDLSAGGVTSYRGMGVTGHGNLVSTQELLSGTVWTPAVGQTYQISTGSWFDIRATSVDALDRPVSSYEAAFGDQPKATNGYDGPGTAGLLAFARLATGELKSFVYDGVGRRTDVTYAYDGGLTPAIHEVFDAGGRVTNRSTSVLGAETLAYDATGALTSVTEPASLGGGTIQYGYYADGMRASAGYSDATHAYPNALQYAYRPDSKRERLLLGSGAFTWTYTAAGRVQTQSDPLTGRSISPTATYTIGHGAPHLIYPASMTYNARTLSYDSYGRPAGVNLPETFSYSYAASQYDLEDATAEETRNPYVGTTYGSTLSPRQICVKTNARKEQLPNTGQVSCANSWGLGPVDLNGTMLIATSAGGGTNSYGGLWLLDARSGMKSNNRVADTRGLITGSQYLYDTSGRMTQNTEASDKACPAGYMYASVQNPYCYRYGTRTKIYDAENRLRSDIYPYVSPNAPTQTTYGTSYGDFWMEEDFGFYQPASLTADYDVSSHPARIAQYHPDWGTTQTLGWLWDGDDRFLQCQLVNSQCTQPTFSLEGLGDYDPLANQITVYDRNLWGLVVTYHTASRFGSWTDSYSPGAQVNPRNGQDPCSDGNANDPTTCDKLRYGKLTADGWTIDNDTWQGVRTSDLSVGQWNTPDAYAGEVHDPMSQKPFMWNRNNPYQYADPSGYIWTYIDAALKAEVETLSKKSETFSKSYKAAQDSELEFSMRVVPAADVSETRIPGYEHAGISETRVFNNKSGDVGGAQVNIADNLKGDTLQAGLAAEVFNAGRVGSDYAALLSDFNTPDGKGNVAEKKGLEAQAKIMSEVKAKKK